MSASPPSPDDGLRESKRDLRARILAARAALSARARADDSAAACERLLGHPAWASADTVAAYLSIGEELDTHAFVHAILRSGRRLLLPRIVEPDRPERRHLVLHAVSDPRADTVAGRWGIREPDPRLCPEVAPDAVDLMLVPGLAFDRQGGRLGYGAGYYDRLLARTGERCVRIAALFEVQYVDRVPMQPHDQRVHWLVSAREECRAGGA